MLAVWFHWYGQGTLPHETTVLDGFANVGIRLYPLTSDTPTTPGIVFLDGLSPDLSEFLHRVSRGGAVPVLSVSLSLNSLPENDAMALMEAGAADVVNWNILHAPHHHIALRLRRWEEISALIRDPIVTNNLIGTSPLWLATLRQIIEVACFSQSSILLTGESGTGKELLARLIHTLDRRADKGELVIVDCTTIVPELSGSEFFGHEKGAFTGAIQSRDGAFAIANNGTLFLDEVGELRPDLQAQLLRVVQEGSYKRVGGNQWTQTRFRLVCATNRNLWQEVREGKFRQDLFFRIATFDCRLPPLRERPDDVLPLAQHFLKEQLQRDTPPAMDELVMKFLRTRAYPGNTRELKHLIARMCQTYIGEGPLTVGTVPPEARRGFGNGSARWQDDSFALAISRALSHGAGLKEISRAAEEKAIQIILDRYDGNLQKASRALGVTDRALQIRRATQRNRMLSPRADHH